MFEKNNSLPDRLIKKVSIVESFYNPLEKNYQNAFRDLWLKHTGSTRPNFYKRLARPVLEDYALIVYFLELTEGDSPYILDHFKDSFKDENGNPYPTYKDFNK